MYAEIRYSPKTYRLNSGVEPGRISYNLTIKDLFA